MRKKKLNKKLLTCSYYIGHMPCLSKEKGERGEREGRKRGGGRGE